jgi:hypothetical protein
MGCNLKEPAFHNATTKTIRVCTSFLEKLWNSTNFNSPTTIYDNCGFKKLSTLNNLTDKSYIIPSQVLIFIIQIFPNVTFFLENIKIPYFEGYKFEFVNDTDKEKFDCYGKEEIIHASIFRHVILFALFFII